MRAKSQKHGQAFSEAVYAQTQADGILYLSRLTSSRCCAVYDRGVPKLASGPITEVVALPDLVPCLAALNIELVPQS